MSARVSAIKNGNKFVNPGFTPGWYKVNDFATGQTGTVSMNDLLTTVQADAAMMGLRARICAFAIYQESDDYVLPASGLGTPFLCTTQQRGCYTKLQVTQPNIKAPYTDKALTLSEWQLRSRYTNVIADSLKREHKRFQNAITDELKQTLIAFPPSFQDVYGRASSWNLTAATFNGSRDLVYRNDPTKGWETETGIVICSDPAGRTDKWTDITVIPATAFSGLGLAYDNIPLELTTDKDSPWTFSLTRNQVNGKNLPALFDTGAVAKTSPNAAELWVYLTFVPDSADWCFGVLYQHVDMPVGGNAFNLDAHYYLSLAAFPNFNSARVNGASGTDIAIDYDNYFNIVTQANIRQFVENQQTFPLVRESDYQKLIDGVNVLSKRLSSNPELLFSINGGFTSTRRGNGAGEVPMGTPYGLMTGESTEFPILPVVFNSLAAKGFPNGFMAVPTSGTAMKVQIENVTLSNTQQASFKATYVSEKFDLDSMTLKAAAQYGVARYTQNMNVASFNPMVLSNTGKNDVVAPLVPNVASNPA